MLLIFGAIPPMLLALIQRKLSLTWWQFWLVVIILGAFSYYPLSKMVLGPPLFSWQPPFMISNQVFFLMPPVIYLASAGMMKFAGYHKKQSSSTLKYQNSFTSSEELDLLQAKLDRLIDEEKVYIDQDITLNSLALMLRSDRHTVSRLINQRYQKNFFQFINSLRIRDFISLAQKRENRHRTFQELAHLVGFRNKTSFINAFKKETKRTPSDYFLK